MITLEEFEAILARRGYDYENGFIVVKTTKAVTIRVLRAISPEFVNYLGIKLLVEELDQTCGIWQHHMQHDCGFPLLRETHNRRTIAYRAAPLGPRSTRLLECPQCWQHVQDDSVKEIED